MLILGSFLWLLLFVRESNTSLVPNVVTSDSTVPESLMWSVELRL